MTFNTCTIADLDIYDLSVILAMVHELIDSANIFCIDRIQM